MNEIDKLPGLKESELIALGPCIICGKPALGSDNSSPTFYVVDVAHACFDMAAINRRVGLQMVLGGHDALARAMGPDGPLARIVNQPRKVFVHEGCAGQIGHVLELSPKESDPL